MTLSLKTAWTLWEKVEKGWEKATPEKGKPDPTPPTKEPGSYEKPKVVDAQKETPSGLNNLENEESFVPGHDKDAKVMQLKTELAKLEEALLEIELEEAFITPDVGVSTYGLGLMGGGVGLHNAHTYDRNFCPDPPAPEESGEGAPHLDPSNTLLAPKQFIPKEQLAEHAAWADRLRRSKIQG